MRVLPACVYVHYAHASDMCVCTLCTCIDTHGGQTRLECRVPRTGVTNDCAGN